MLPVNLSSKPVRFSSPAWSPGVIKDMQVQSFKDMDTLLSKVDFKNKDVYIIPYGGSVMPKLKEEYAELCSNI